MYTDNLNIDMDFSTLDRLLSAKMDLSFLDEISEGIGDINIPSFADIPNNNIAVRKMDFPTALIKRRKSEKPL